MQRMAVILVLALFASACGSRPTVAQVVPVELTEFAIETPITVFKVGSPYRFVINNPGLINHEFVLLADGQEHHMPAEDEHGHEDAGHGHEDSQAMGNMLHVGESDLTPGATVTIEHTFTEPGEYEFGCFLPGHYEAGMYTRITVVH